MVKGRVIFQIEAGDFHDGFGVSLHYYDHRQALIFMDRGRLPANPVLVQVYQQWRECYLAWGGAVRIDPIFDQPINISYLEQAQLKGKALSQHFNQWLDSESFRPLRRKLEQALAPQDAITFILQTSELHLQRLPWGSWNLFEAFPLLQLVIAPDSYRALEVRYPLQPLESVNLLAVLADGEGLNLDGDRHLLEALPNTQLQLLDNPSRKVMTDALWQRNWDILFFAGHSSSVQGRGKFTIAQNQWMSLDAVKYSLQTAARKGLKIAIFNSCDGLAIAQDLVRHDVPFIITMREPVPDLVAQSFLEYFLTAYSAGQSLFQAFQDAQQRLESLEDQCPCATWLPVLLCNPGVSPPTWLDLLGQAQDAASLAPVIPRPAWFHHWPVPQGWPQRTEILFFLSIVLGILLLRSFGGLQGAELWAFDQFLQRRPMESADARLLVVEIDEAMVRSQSTAPGSISDDILQRSLTQLLRYHPRVIGIDIYRDHENLAPALQKTLATQSQVVGVCKSPDTDLDGDPEGVQAPIGLPAARVGFSDVLEDPDGVVRRQLLFMTPENSSMCAVPWAFASRLALQYLAADQIQPRFSSHPEPLNQHLILAERDVLPIRLFWGGYQRINLGGNQIMLNYRARSRLDDIAAVVSIRDVLNDRVPEAMIRDRLVIIGVTASSMSDFWETPYSKAAQPKIAGVFLQAHMASQLMSAVLDHRPLIHVWPRSLEILWILAWGVLGLISPKQRVRRWSLQALSVLGLLGVSFLGLWGGLWLPLIPSLMVLSVMSLYRQRFRH